MKHLEEMKEPNMSRCVREEVMAEQPGVHEEVAVNGEWTFRAEGITALKSATWQPGSLRKIKRSVCSKSGMRAKRTVGEVTGDRRAVGGEMCRLRKGLWPL